MGRANRMVVVGAVALVVGLGAASCSDDKKSAPTTSSTAVPTIAGCPLQPGANCAGANLTSANLTGANLSGANLVGANLTSANLTNTNLSGANLTDANLTKATLLSTNLSAANLTKVNFTGATLENVNLANATRCGTIRTNGTIDDTSCPPPAPAGSSTTAARATTTQVTSVPLTSPCTSQALTEALQVQGGYYGLSVAILQGIQAVGAPACATSFATQMFSAGPNGPGEFKAVFAAAPNNGWHLLGINGCQPSMNIPSHEATGIC